MDVLHQCIQTRAYEHRQGSKTFAWSSSLEIKMSMGLVNLTFAKYTYHQHIGWMSRNCCGDGVFSGAAKAWKGSEAFSWLYACVSCLSVWSQDRMEFYVKVVGSLLLFPSSFFSFVFSLFIFFTFLFFYFFYISLLLFFFFSPLFLSSKPRLTPSWNKDTPLDGWNLKRDAMRFPPHLDFVWKSSVQCRGLLLSVFPFQRASKCSYDAVLMFSDIVCPLFFLIVTWHG